VIAELEGRVSRLSPTHLVVVAGGVGYKVAVTPSTVERATHSRDHMRLLVHTVVREDAIDLYGFATEDELELFELLLTVSGVGPKTAVGIIGGASAEVLRDGIGSGDAAYLTKIAGVSKKIAERLTLELKGKVGALGAASSGGATSGAGDAVEALSALGFSDSDARAAVAKQDRSLSAEEIVRRALKELGRKS
jgi:Holliday junction DNA helicase RuvA